MDKYTALIIQVLEDIKPDMCPDLYLWDYEGLIYIKDELFRKGFKYLGNGSFSAAFEHIENPGKVYKIGFDFLQDGWIQWAAYSMANYGLPLVPYIDYVKRFNKRTYIACMDKLIMADDFLDFSYHLKFQELAAVHAYTLEQMMDDESFMLAEKSPLLDQLAPLRDAGVLGDIKGANVGFTSKGEMVLLDPQAWQEPDFNHNIFKSFTKKERRLARKL